MSHASRCYQVPSPTECNSRSQPYNETKQKEWSPLQQQADGFLPWLDLLLLLLTGFSLLLYFQSVSSPTAAAPAFPVRGLNNFTVAVHNNLTKLLQNSWIRFLLLLLLLLLFLQWLTRKWFIWGRNSFLSCSHGIGPSVFSKPNKQQF